MARWSFTIRCRSSSHVRGGMRKLEGSATRAARYGLGDWRARPCRFRHSSSVPALNPPAATMASRRTRMVEPATGASMFRNPAKAAQRPSHKRRASRSAMPPANPAAGGAGVQPHTANTRSGSYSMGRMRRSRLSGANSVSGSKNAITGDAAAFTPAFQASASPVGSFRSTTMSDGSVVSYTARTGEEGSSPAAERCEGTRCKSRVQGGISSAWTPSNTNTSSWWGKYKSRIRRAKARDLAEASRATMTTETAGTRGDFSRMGTSSRVLSRASWRSTRQPFHATHTAAAPENNRMPQANWSKMETMAE